MVESLNYEELICKNLEELPKIANSIVAIAGTEKIWLFYGEMGSGKTTLIKALCKELKVKDNVTSPTYSIVNEYKTEEGGSIYHFDFYRLKSESEAMDIGYEDYFYSGDICLVEWPEKIPDLLPTNFLKVELSILEEGSRLILLSRK